jgi:hypothetical protein
MHCSEIFISALGQNSQPWTNQGESLLQDFGRSLSVNHLDDYDKCLSFSRMHVLTLRLQLLASCYWQVSPCRFETVAAAMERSTQVSPYIVNGPAVHYCFDTTLCLTLLDARRNCGGQMCLFWEMQKARERLAMHNQQQQVYLYLWSKRISTVQSLVSLLLVSDMVQRLEYAKSTVKK